MYDIKVRGTELTTEEAQVVALQNIAKALERLAMTAEKYVQWVTQPQITKD